MPMETLVEVSSGCYTKPIEVRRLVSTRHPDNPEDKGGYHWVAAQHHGSIVCIVWAHDGALRVPKCLSTGGAVP